MIGRPLLGGLFYGVNDMAQRERAKVQTGDVKLPETQEIDLSKGAKDVDLAIVTDDDVNTPVMKELLADLAFNEHIIEFSIGMDSNPNAENPVPCGCNGVIHLLERGKRHRLPRKFVDSLIKTTFRVETERFQDKDGLEQTKVKRIPVSAYPISIHHDPANDDGKDLGTRWFEFQNANSY